MTLASPIKIYNIVYSFTIFESQGVYSGLGLNNPMGALTFLSLCDNLKTLILKLLYLLLIFSFYFLPVFS